MDYFAINKASLESGSRFFGYNEMIHIGSFIRSFARFFQVTDSALRYNCFDEFGMIVRSLFTVLYVQLMQKQFMVNICKHIAVFQRKICFPYFEQLYEIIRLSWSFLTYYGVYFSTRLKNLYESMQKLGIFAMNYVVVRMLFIVFLNGRANAFSVIASDSQTLGTSFSKNPILKGFKLAIPATGNDQQRERQIIRHLNLFETVVTLAQVSTRSKV